MTYETIAAVSQILSLAMVGGMFIAVFAYAFWPSSRGRFDAAQRSALDLDTRSSP